MQSNKIKVTRAIRQCKIVLLNNKLKTADTGSLYSALTGLYVGSIVFIDFILFYFISFVLKNTKKTHTHCRYANKILGQGHRNS